MAKSRDEVLSGLAEMRASQESEAEPEATEPEPVDKSLTPGELIQDSDDDDEEEESEEESDDEESDEEAEESDDEEAEEEPEDEKPDESDKELARIQEAEKEAKQRIQGQIEELEAKKAELDERLAKAEEAEAKTAKLSKQFKVAPVAFAKSQGLETHADFLALGATLYKYGKGLAPDADAQHKEWAKSVEKEGEQASTFSELQAQIAELKAEREAEKAEKATAAEQAETQRTLDEYASRVISEAGDDTPLAKAVLADADEETKQSLLGLAMRMAQDLGQPPTPEQLLAQVEEYERAQLKKRGIDPDKHFPKTKAKAKPDSASKKKKATKKKPKATKPRTKTREEILQGLRERNAANEAHK